MWSSMTAAYDALSFKMQTFLEGLTAVHDFSHGFKESLAEPGGRERLADAVAANPPVHHPVIRTHPETGERGIYTNIGFTSHILDVEPEESQEILRHLERQIMSPSVQCRVRWQKDTFVMWDNRSAQHAATNDFLPMHRRMERVTVIGDRPF